MPVLHSRYCLHATLHEAMIYVEGDFKIRHITLLYLVVALEDGDRRLIVIRILGEENLRVFLSMDFAVSLTAIRNALFLAS